MKIKYLVPLTTRVLMISLMPGAAQAILHGVPSHHPRHLPVQQATLRTRGICTGTFISPRIYVTAAHCLKIAGAKRSSGTGDQLQLRVGGMSPVRFQIFEGNQNSQDIALVDFPQNRQFQYLPISATPPREGDSVELVGFGFSTQQDPSTGGIRRSAWNTLAQKIERQWVLQWIVGTYPQKGMTLTGDSGGPLLDTQGRLIGIANQNSPRPIRISRKLTHISSFVDLTDPEVRRFIVQTTRTWNTPIPSLPFQTAPTLLSRPLPPPPRHEATAAK